MRSIYKAFKKHYQLCKDVWKEMSATGGFEFHLNFTQNSGEAKLDTPAGDLTMRFIMVMRRFLNPADRLYYKSVWAKLLEEFGDVVSEQLKTEVEKKLPVLANGIIEFNWYGEVLTQERIYEIIAEGIHFGRNEQYSEYLEQIERNPFAKPLFWYQFYSYMEHGLEIASIVYEAITTAEKTDKYQQLYGDLVVARCIYCLSTDGPFKGEEHIIPEAMGNNDYVLPRGYVCDPCNNGVLSQLDDSLRTSPLFITQWVSAVGYTKQGKLPEVRLGNITIKRTDPLNVSWIADARSDAIRAGKQRADGTTPLHFKTTMPKGLDEHVVARALCKIGLAAIALDFGHDYALSSRFDAARRFITEGGDFRNNLLLSQWMAMRTDIRLQYQHLQDVPGTVMVHQIYGVLLIMNLEEEPLLKLPPPIYRKLGLVAFPLYGKRRRTKFTLRLLPPPDQVA